MLDKNNDTDGTVGKAMKLLDIVESFRKPVKFNDILECSPYPKPSTYRLLQTLANQNMLFFNAETGHYSLGSRLIRLAYSAWQTASLAPIASSYIEELSVKTGQTIHLAQLDHGQVLYIDKKNSNQPITMFSGAGKIGPAYCTGVGKAMLAHIDYDKCQKIIAQQSFYPHTKNTLISAEALNEELKQIYEQGVSFDREEHEPNIICIAVPILTQNREVVGGISITSSTARMSLEELANYKDVLQETAKKIGEDAAVWMLPKMGG